MVAWFLRLGGGFKLTEGLGEVWIPAALDEPDAEPSNDSPRDDLL